MLGGSSPEPASEVEPLNVGPGLVEVLLPDPPFVAVGPWSSRAPEDDGPLLLSPSTCSEGASALVHGGFTRDSDVMRERTSLA